jgi:hypothetical protein
MADDAVLSLKSRVSEAEWRTRVELAAPSIGWSPSTVGTT